jgi:hypothetical protein
MKRNLTDKFIGSINPSRGQECRPLGGSASDASSGPLHWSLRMLIWTFA